MYGCEKRPPLIAKSPSSEGTASSKRGRSLLLAASNLQAVSGLLMLVFGVLCAAYGSSLSRLGGGLWGGLTALGAGAIGTAAALRPRRLHQTLYLALCLVSLAVNTLVLLLTLTATVKDSRFDNHENLHNGMWAGQWCGIGLLGATSLHLLATLVSVPLTCKKSCAGPEPGTHELQDTKHHLVSSWLGRHNPVLTPHHLLIDVPAVYTLPYPQGISPGHRPPRHYRHRHPPPPRSASQINPPEPVKKPKKKREITDEEIDKTYTGLDREIAEEFISIAMQPKPPSTRSVSSISQIIP
ncbi:uncharacterized protein [Halyomorpha halys]|uniref:uncharacterized protein n=1 Tax=Halyomorpha halys TaxID=286706 RepID=UPI0006D4E111